MQRKRQSKAAALAGPAFNVDGATVELYQVLGDRQAQACAFTSASAGVAHLVKLFKDRRMLLLWNADSRVTDRDVQTVSLAEGLNPDAPAFRRKFHRVAQQVIQHLLYAQAVRIERIMKAVFVFQDNVFCGGLVA